MKQQFIIITFLIILFTNAYSHPHTFIEVKPTVQIKDKNIDNIHIKWTLDEMTSMMLIMELDTDANGKFNKKENTFIYENYFTSLVEQNYYMQIQSNKKIIPFKPTNFKASIEKNRLIYAFDIKKDLNLDNLKVEFFDESLFVGMMLEKNYITINGIETKQSNKIKKTIFGLK